MTQSGFNFKKTPLRIVRKSVNIDAKIQRVLLRYYISRPYKESKKKVI